MNRHPNFRDKTGLKIGRLLVLSVCEKVRPQNGYFYLCRCDCGNEKKIAGGHLRNGVTQSCGCLRNERVSESNKKFITHGQTIGGVRSPEYAAWRSMKDRCLDERLKSYKDYGGRGITICNRWLQSFENFLSDMGKRTSPKHSLDRIDNYGNYEASNCRWATKQQQQLNKRTNRVLVVGGVSKIIPDWNKEKGFGRMTIRNRLNLGWTVEQCVNTPLKKI